MRSLGSLLTLAAVLVLGCGRGTLSGDLSDTIDPFAEHGSVQVEVVEANQSTGTFEGTARVIVQLEYLDCLTQFYADSPELTQSGSSRGILGN